jgi:hypothetical protein
VVWLHTSPAQLAANADGGESLMTSVLTVGKSIGLLWRETNYLLLRRGPYVIAAGMDESISGASKVVSGRYIDLFDSALHVRSEVALSPGSRLLLLDLDAIKQKQPCVLASACKSLTIRQDKKALTLSVEGVAGTQAVVLVRVPKTKPKSITLAGSLLPDWEHSEQDRLVWIHFQNESRPRELVLNF